MKKWLATAKPGNRGESLRTLQEVSKERITSVADQYFTKLWRVGESQGRGAPSIEYRDRQKAKAGCVKTFVEKYDTVTAPSGEGQAVRKQMTVQVEEWWNSSDVAVSLREENRAFATSWQLIEPMFVAPWWTKSLFCAPKMGDPLYFRLNGIRI